MATTDPNLIRWQEIHHRESAVHDKIREALRKNPTLGEGSFTIVVNALKHIATCVDAALTEPK